MKKGKVIGAGPRIKEWRKSKNLKLDALAKIIKASQGSLSDIENGKSDPSAKTILGFMLYTDIDFVWLMTGKEGAIPGRSITPKRDRYIKKIKVSKNIQRILIERE